MDIPPADLAARPLNTAWQLDRRVPLALIGALGLQTLGVAWWAASVTFRLDDHERRVVTLEHSDTAQLLQFTAITERLARIDERLAILVEEHRPERQRPPVRELP
jgi:hypothetical protein